MLKSEEEIRAMYRSYIELYACSINEDKSDKDILYGALLAYGRVLGFSATKVHRDMHMARGKYMRI